MAIELIVTGDTGRDAAIELNNFIATLIGLNGAAKPLTSATETTGKPASSTTVTETKPAASTAAPVSTARKATTAKPKKGEAGEASPEDNSDVDISLEGARVIIKRIVASAGKDEDAGIQYSLGIIQSFGVAKLSELPEDQYEAFIDKCKEVLAKGGVPSKKAEANDLGDIF